MKKYLLLIALTWFITNAFSQMPPAFNYQAVARDLTGNPANDITNGAVTLTPAASAVFPGTSSEADSKIPGIQMSPAVNAGFDQLICEDQTAQLNGSASNYSSISWTRNVSNPGIPNPVYTSTSADIAAGFAELCLTSSPIISQTIEVIDCDLYVDAGFDATIGETETFTTNPQVYNAEQIYWYSTGDGFFDNETSEITNYYPGINDIANGFVELCLWGMGFEGCFDYSDCLIITIIGLPEVFAGNDATINEGENYSLTGAMADQCSSLFWTTSGDGSFNNPMLLNPQYTPGSIDITEGMVELCLTGYNQIGITTDCMTLTFYDKHFITLPEGWTSISSYLVPNHQEVAQLMAAIEEKLIILSDFEGNIYQPDNKNLFNWNFTKGYYIKMASSDTLEISGLCPINKQLELQVGWNLIPVLSDAVLAIEDLFYGNIQKVEIITEVAGVNVYWPEHEIATLHQLIPGKAYLVKASEPFLLPKLPDVTTTSLSNITGFTATSGGSATNEGNWPVTSRGVVWSTTQNPTISNYNGITNNGDGSGNWVSELTGLIPFTTYYVRAYATNYFGTAYGEELMFTTPFVCGHTFTDSRDGKNYSTVQIGTQCWMAQNLNIGTRIDGYANPANNGTIEKYCYNNTEANCDVYGGLYQWNEMMQYTTTAGAKGICPTGWHLPTYAEWTTLTTYVSSQTAYRCNNNSAYIAKSLAATTNWTTYSGTCAIGDNLSANNTTGFTATPGGYRFYSFYYLSYYGYWWTSTEYDGSNAWGRYLGYNSADMFYISTSKGYGFSVRCLRDL